MEKDLRLRLVVRRHGVPDVKILWNVAADGDLTISKLVAQINDVIPLESGEWGLEDYAVELKDASGEGFECVHYHLVSKTLKDDDQILIRPLLSDDLKRRRLSGRHQISSDGKHLVDGLAFGRPWLKAPRDRPVVAIPPRKKARLTYSSEEENEVRSLNDEGLPPMLEYGSMRAQEDPSSVKLRARFFDAKHDDDDEEEEDDDFDPAADGDDEEDMDTDDDDLQEELRLIREDNAAAREGDIINELRDIRRQEASSGTGGGKHSLSANDHSPVPSASNALVRSGTMAARAQTDLDYLDKVGALRVAFKSAPIAVIGQTLLKYAKDPAKTYRKLSKSFAPQLDIHQMLELQSRSLSSSPVRQTEPAAARQQLFGDTSPSEPDSSASSSLSDGDGEDASATLKHNTHMDVDVDRDSVSSESDSDESSSGSGSEPSDSEAGHETHSSSDDDASEDSDDESGESEDGSVLQETHSEPARHHKPSSSDDDSSSDSSNSDSSSSNGSSVIVKRRNASAKLRADTGSSSESPSESSSESSSEDSSSEDSSSDSEPEEVPTKTLTKQYTALHFAKSSQPQEEAPQDAPQAQVMSVNHAPPVPPGQGLSKTQKRNARRKLAKKIASQARSTSALSSRDPSQAATSEAVDEDAALLARKQALLNAIGSDAAEPQSQEKSQETPDSAPHVSANKGNAAASSKADETSPSSAADEAAQRRMKPNVGAARRMLLGSLGLRNPKTKADEETIRQDLMKGVRQHTNVRLTEAASQPGESVEPEEAADTDPEAWREKIAYRAVECCHDGVELSEPPFPFVQRWDPQQQVEEWFGSKNKRGGKRKRAQRNQAHYYEDGDSQSSKKRRISTGSGVLFSGTSEYLEEGDTTLNYDDPPSDDPPANRTALEESQATDYEDLPSLPSDLTTLPDLRPGEANIGMVITWKQMVLSSATNWQPEVVDFTGVLVRVHDEEKTDLEFLLARRDRNLDRNEKVYDESTGRRVYDRFEAPDEDDGDQDDDCGYRRLLYSELIEPKIVQHPLEDKEKASGNGNGNDNSSTGPSDSVVHETVYEDQSQLSHVNGEKSGQSPPNEDGSQSEADGNGGKVKTNAANGQPQVTAESDRHLYAIPGDGQSSPNVESQAAEVCGGITDEADLSTPKPSTRTKVDDEPLPNTEDTSSQRFTLGRNGGDAVGSIDSDRRHEISLMIAEAGFRQDLSPSITRRKTSSPSRQLFEMSEAASTSRVPSKSPLSEHVEVKDSTPNPGEQGAQTTARHAEAAPPSSASSIRSGRQPDEFSFHIGGDDLPQISETGGQSPILGASPPRPDVRTPTRSEEASVERLSINSMSSFPPLDENFLSAVSQRSTQTPSKSQVFSLLKSRTSIVKRDEDYEAAMRRIDEEEDDQHEDRGDDPDSLYRSTRKQLFPNSTQPTPASPSALSDFPDLKPISKTAPSSFTETQDVKPFIRTRKRKSSPFAVPAGSQVIALSSSQSNPSDEDDLGEHYAEDDIDDDYQEKSSSLPRGPGWVQKKKQPRATSRAKSTPAAGKAVGGGRRSPPSSTQPAKSNAKSRAQRRLATRF